jgi:hypothetical protein
MNEEPNVSLMDENEAAQMLACSPALLRKWRQYGGGPDYCRIGRLVRYQLGELQAFIAAHQVEGASHR